MRQPRARLAEADNAGFPLSYGRAGTDFPLLSQDRSACRPCWCGSSGVCRLPQTGFTCAGRVNGGLYADPAAGCQVRLLWTAGLPHRVAAVPHV